MVDIGLPLAAKDAKAIMEAMGGTVMFEKVLTTSDTSGSGRIVIPKSIAESNFPAIDVTIGINLPLLDSFGKRHSFRFRFWINNASRMYLVEGTQELQKRYKLGVGDVLMFAKDASGGILVCGRKGTKEDISRKTPLKRGAASRAEASSSKETNKRATLARATSASENPTSSEKTVAAAAKPAAAKEKSAAKPPKAGPIADPAAPASASAAAPKPPKTSAAAPASRAAAYQRMQHGQEDNRRQQEQKEAEEAPRVHSQYGYWTAVVSLGGELYQAFFDSRDAADAAFEAARQDVA